MDEEKLKFHRAINRTIKTLAANNFRLETLILDLTEALEELYNHCEGSEKHSYQEIASKVRVVLAKSKKRM